VSPAADLADVVLLGGIPGLYTYVVPPGLTADAVPGRRVVVPFSKRLRAGVVVARRKLEAPPPRPLATIDRCLDDGPLVSRAMLELCRWAAAYYACEPTHALKAALPPGALGTELRRWVLTEAGRRALDENRHAPRLRQAMAAIASNDTSDDAAPLPEPLARELAAEGLARDASTFEAGAEEPKVELALLLEPAGQRTTFPKAHRLLSEVYALLKEQPRQLVEALRAKVPDARSALSRLEKRGLVRIDRVPRPREPARPFEQWPRLTEDQ
jgi:primosomal protein N' (replication factor Y)